MEDQKISYETIQFRGHQNVLGTHRNTLEITTDGTISKRADCILGVEATKACRDLSPEMKLHIKSGGFLRFEISVENLSYSFLGKGSSDLELIDPHEMVFRRSNFVSPRTVAISCSAAAIDIPRQLVKMLQKPEIFGSLKIVALKETESTIPDTPQIEFIEISA